MGACPEGLELACWFLLLIQDTFLLAPLEGKDWGLTDLDVYQGRLWLGLGCVGDTADLASPRGPHSLNVEEQ